MAAPQFSNWFLVSDGKEISSAHVPAVYWQYRWYLDAEFAIPHSWFGVSGGLMRMEFELTLGDGFGSSDKITFVCVVQRDLFTGSLVGFYTYYPGSMSMTGALDYPTWASNQPYWEYAGETSGVDASSGWVNGWFTSPIFKVGLPAGSVVDIIKFYPSINIPLTGVALQMRTALEAPGKKRMLVDPVTADRHLPRTEDGMLLLRTRMHDGRLTGIQSGLGLTTGAITGDTIAVPILPGAAVIGYDDYRLAEGVELAVSMSGTWYVSLTPDGAGGISVTAEQWPVTYPGLVIARIKNGALTRCNGVLIADGVSDGQYAPGRNEDGRMMMVYDTTGGGRDVVRTSRDRGVSWEDGD